METISSRKRSQQQMLDNDAFMPLLNSTFIDLEGKEKECAKIVHDLVFQRYGGQRKLYRSKRLKVLREIFYPDVVDESYPNGESIIDFRDVMRINEDQQGMKEIIRKVNSESMEYGLNRSETFCVGDKEDELLNVHEDRHDEFLNDSIKICRQQMNLTYSQSVGSEDISDLISDQSTYFSTAKSASKSMNDDNNNTVMDQIEESNEVDEKDKQTLQNYINAQDLAIQEFQRVLLFGRRKRGFAGSIPHIQAEKGLLVANIRKQVIAASLNDEFHCSTTREDNLTGKIVINNIKCDTNIIIGHNNGISPCYYLCIAQHKSTVLCTDILAPDMHGVVEFPNKFILENISNTFTIKLLLFKLQLKPITNSMRWKKSLGRRQIELPKLVLIGNHDVSIANINTTAFSSSDEILYANFTTCVHMANKKEGPVTIQKIVRKSKTNTKLVSHRRWCVLEGTDLKVYRCRQDVDYCEPVEVISLVYCKSCRPNYSTPTTIMLDFVHAYFGRTLYLPFNDKESFRGWLKHINMAISTARCFGL